MKNKVELIGFYGGDKTHCLSAWCSTFSELGIEIPDYIPDRIDAIFDYVIETKKSTPEKLLTMLAESGHGTPFEKSMLHFLVTCDIASHIHLLKHRIGVSINSESSRYKELKEDKFYVPYDWPEEEYQKHVEFCEQAMREYHECLTRLQKHYEGLGWSRTKARKRAKETARFKLPYSTQLTCDLSFNWRSFYHFLGLRYSTHAQDEIRDIASQMLEKVFSLSEFDKTLKAFQLMKEDGSIVEPFETNFMLAK